MLFSIGFAVDALQIIISQHSMLWNYVWQKSFEHFLNGIFHLCLSLLSRCKSICFDFVYSQTENVIFSFETYIRLYCLILGWISRMLAIACHRHRDYAQSLKYCNFKVNSNSFLLTRLSNMSKVKREREKLDFIRKKKIVKTNKQNVEQNNNNK